MKQFLSCLSACLFLLTYPAISQVNTINELLSSHDNSIRQVDIDETDIYNQISQKKSTLKLPYLNSQREFNAEEFSMWGPIKSPYKDIKTYRLHDPNDQSITGRLMFSSSGVFITYLQSGKFIRTYPVNDGAQRIYQLEVGNGRRDDGAHTCEVHNTGMDYLGELKETYNPGGHRKNGSMRRKYRVAVVLTGEYMTGNGTLADAANLAVANLMDISAIFERELNVELYHTERSPYTRYRDPNTDPFDPNGDARPNQAADAVDDIWPSTTEYDIGHVFHKHAGGDGWATGGVARLAAVCNDNRFPGNGPPSKAYGWSGSFNNQNTSWISLAAHEFGHMFNATHTWNGIGGSACDDTNHPDDTAYEIGSGTTIMSYNGLCEAGQNIPSSGVADDYFHVNSLDRMVSHIETFTCNESEWEDDVNTPPVANANPCGITNFRIPRNTPFKLTGEGTDEDGDLITYCWEQYNEDGIGNTTTHGNIGSAAALSVSGPNFRSYPPTTSPTRYIPNLEDVHLNANTKDFEALPQVAKDLAFRLTVRDNNPTGGGIDWDELGVSVTRDGPLRITFPGRNDNLVAGEEFTFEWETRGSDDLCDKATISASFDGGITYPYILATDVDYDAGQLNLTIPGGFPNTDKARLKIECADYECFTFFDVVDRDFEIASNCSSTNSVLCDTETEEFNTGASGLDLGLETYVGKASQQLSGPLQPTANMRVPMTNNSGDCVTPLNFENAFHSIEFIVSETGNYNFLVDNSGDNTSFYSIHERDGFNPASACENFVASTHFWSGTSPSFNLPLQVSAQLESCKEYLLITHVSGASQETFSVVANGPGLFVVLEEDPDYSETFVAINTDNDEIVAIDENSDFRTLDAGTYIIRSIMYKSGGATPPELVDPLTWLGQNFSDIQASDNCFSGSFNEKEITVISSCDVQDLDFNDPSACDPATNTYSIRFSFFVDKGPTSGTVSISANQEPAQIFNVNDQNITVELENLPADGLPVDLTFEFSEDSDCNKTLREAFLAPENCCEITLDFGERIDACENDPVELDGGEEGVSYVWFEGNTELAETGRFLTVTDPGNYRVVTNNGSCSKEEEVIITFNDAPTLSPVADLSGCDGNPELVTISSSADSIVWLRGTVIVEENANEYGVTETGDYTVTAINEIGCETTVTFVGSFSESPEVELGDDEALCITTNKDLNAGSPDNTYEWKLNNGDLPETGNVVNANTYGSGEYTVLATNPGNCTTRDTVNIEFRDLPTLDLGPDIVGCEGSNEVLSVDAEGFKVEWLLGTDVIVGEEGEELIALVGGDYTAQVSAGAGCETSTTVNVSYEPSPVVDLGDDRSACPDKPVELNAGDPGNTYVWSSEGGGTLSETSNILLADVSDTYYVSSTNAANCETLDTVEITFTDLPIIDLGDDLDGCEGDNFVLSFDPSGFIVEWSLNNNVIMGVNSGEITAFEAGQYIAKVASGPDCEISDTIIITYTPAPIVELGDDRSACPDKPVELNAGDPSSTFEWSSEDQGTLGETSNILIVDQSDTYYVRVTNAADCETLDTVEITFTDLPIIDLGDDLDGCAGDNFVLSFDPSGFLVEWSLNNNPILAVTGGEITALDPGQYIAKVASGPDCEISDTINITYTPAPVVELGDDRSACPDNPVPLDAGDPSNTYEWSAESQGPLSETSSILNVEVSDTYYVKATNSANCETLDTVTITFTDLPVLDLGLDVEKCEGEEHTIVANNTGFDIEWQLNNNTIAGETADEIIIKDSGTYTAVVSADPTCSVQASVVVTFNPNPELQDIGDSSPCVGDVVNLTAGADGAFVYEWQQNGNIVQSGDQGSYLVPDQDGQYTVLATNEFACTSQDTANILYLETPEISLPDDFEFCNGTTVPIEGVSNTFVEWYLNNDIIPNQSNATLDITIGGQYVAVVGAGGSCERRDTVNVTAIDAPDTFIEGQDQYCSDDTDAVLSVTLDAGETAEWSLNSVVQQQGPSYTITQSGTYSVVVTNQANCSTTYTKVVEFFDVAVNTLPAVPQLCQGDPYQMVAISDGNSFTWTRNDVVISGQTDLSLDIIESGNYQFISENSIGCQTISEFTVTFDPVPIIDLGGAERRECIGFTVPLQGPEEPGNTYVWTKDSAVLPGETSSSLDVTDDGLYGLTVTNSFGCSTSEETLVTFNPAPTYNPVTTDATFCEGSDTEISIETDASIIRWILNNVVIASNVSTLTVNQAGLYQVEVESDDGCVISGEINVEENANPIIDLADISLCVGETEDIDVDPGYASYTWDGITATGASITVEYKDVMSTTTETASLTVVDNFGCSATEEFSITYFALIDASATQSPIEICAGEIVDLSATGGLFYEWTDPNGTLSATDISNPIASPTETTTYTVTVRDDCPMNIAEFDIQVIVNPLPDAFAGLDTMAISGIDFQLNATGGIDYQWDNRDFIQGPSNVADPFINISEETLFTVTVTDENGCQASDDILVGIDKSPIEPVTVITPNGDGVNDELNFRGLEAFMDNELTIFNRWGNVIFKKNGYQLDGVRWDGTRNGADLPADTYYYILKFGELKFKNSLTILRD